MTTNLGFYNTSGTRTHVRFQFSSHASAGGNVAPASAFEAADIRIYRAADGAGFSATQRSSSNGITMTSPFDSLTGFHDVDIDLTDNTDAGFYASGYFYSIILAPDSETIDGQTITGLPLGYFEINVPVVNVTGDLSSTMKTSVETAVQNQLNTAIAGTPTADSINERIKTLDDNYTSTRATNLDNLDVAVSTRSTYAGGDTSGTTTLLGRLTSARAGYLDTLNTGVLLSAASVQSIWDALTSALTTVGSIGKLLVDMIDVAISTRSTYAGGDTAGTTTLLSRLTSTRAGNLDNLDAAISGIPTNPLLDNDIRLDHLDADVSSIPTATENADALLKRDWTLISGEATRSVLNALRFIRNKFSTTETSGKVTIYKEDDSTVAYRKDVTTDPTADPIVEG